MFGLRRSASRRPWSAHELFDRITHYEGIRGWLRHRSRVGYATTGFERGNRSDDFREKVRARMDARVAPQGASAVAVDARAALAKCQIRANRLSGTELLLGAEKGQAAREPGRSRPRDSQDLRATRYSIAGAEDARWCRRRRDLRLGLGGDDDERGAGEGRHHLHVARRGSAGVS